MSSSTNIHITLFPIWSDDADKYESYEKVSSNLIYRGAIENNRDCKITKPLDDGD